MKVNLGKYSKAIVAFLAFCGVLGATLADGNISSEELFAVGSAGAGVLGVYQVRNKRS